MRKRQKKTRMWVLKYRGRIFTFFDSKPTKEDLKRWGSGVTPVAGYFVEDVKKK